METMNTENYQTIVRNAILEIFPKYDTTNEGQIPINKLLPFTQQIFDVLKAPPMNNQQWMTYSKDVDLNFDNKLSKMELFFAIKTYFSKKIKIEKEFDYPDFDDIGKGPGYSNATTFDNRLKGVVDSTYQQHNQSQNNNLNQKGNGGGFGTVANKQVTGFINACFGKMGVDFKVTQDQTNQALDLLSKNFGAKKEQNNNTANTNTNTNTNNSNNANYYPNNQSNPNNNYQNYNQNNNNNQYSYNSSNNTQNQRSNQGTDKMDIFMTLKNFLGK